MYSVKRCSSMNSTQLFEVGPYIKCRQWHCILNISIGLIRQVDPVGYTWAHSSQCFHSGFLMTTVALLISSQTLGFQASFPVKYNNEKFGFVTKNLSNKFWQFKYHIIICRFTCKFSKKNLKIIDQSNQSLYQECRKILRN